MAQLDARWEQLRAAFSVELEERVRALNQLLLRLERAEPAGPERTDALDALFREAHSLKGAARAIELGDMEQLAHALESALDAARKRREIPAGSWFDSAFRAVDVLLPLYRSAMEGDGSRPPDFPEVLARLGGPDSEGLPEAPPGQAEPADARADVGPAQDYAATLRPTVVPPPPAPAVPPRGPAAPRPTVDTAVTRAGTDIARVVASDTVRVAVDKLDALLAQAGELAVTHIRVRGRLNELRELRRTLDSEWRRWRSARGLGAHLRRRALQTDGADELEGFIHLTERAEQGTRAALQHFEEIVTRLGRDAAQLGLVTHAIEDEVMGVRLLPMAMIFGPLDRMVRDLTHEKGKEARLELRGGETEIDRRMLEQLRDPLMHMLRNAVDHGIEPPDERVGCGKPRSGTICLSALQRGGVVEIEIEDDGAGLDPHRLRQAAVRKGILTEEQAASLGDPLAMELIFQPGFSTAAAVTETSGRGVGLDVVRQHVEELNGQVVLRSVLGQGTCFTIRVPLTLASTRAILVEQNGQAYAIPLSVVERNSRVREGDLVSLEGRRAVDIEGHPVPVLELADALERPRTTREGPSGEDWRPFFVLSQGDRRIAMLVDGLMGEQEMVIKSLGWPARRVRNVAGAAVLGSGQTVVILNPFDLLKTGFKLLGAGAQPGRVAAVQPEAKPRRRRLLVVEDSLTTRTLLRSILEAAGYQVMVAADGIEALSVLQAEAIDLVVSDVDMPRMDGFGLTAEIRRDGRLGHTPVVLVTALEAQEHRERGVAVGADAYIVKSGFDQSQLLETIGRLL